MTDADVTVVPASEASWEDLQAVFGTAYPSRCLCQRFKVRDRDRTALGPEERVARLKEQTGCGTGRAETSGLVAFQGEQPVGWCAVEPRSAYLLSPRHTAWAGRDEDPDDPSVWAVTCFLVRTGYRDSGIAYALARAAVEHARSRGAAALEGYPIDLVPGERITWDEIGVGPRSVFEEAGFTEVSRPSKRRCVMRIDF